MSEMSRADAELVYKHLNEPVRGDVEAEAYDAALEEFGDVDALEAADDDPESSFSWDGITYEYQRGNLDRDELIPVAGVKPDDEPEVYELAHDFGWLVVEHIREEIQELQAKTMYSPRQFVALVLSAAEHTAESLAAKEMDISVGNYRGKIGDVESKLETAKETVRITDRVRA